MSTLAVVLSFTAAVAGCATNPTADPTTSPGSPTTTAARTAGAQVTGSMESIGRYTRALVDRRNEDLRTCMSTEGFPQLVRAAELTAQRTPPASLDPLRVDPLEAGPYTKDQARRFGMVGTVILFSPTEPGSVISRDPSYDAALQGCEARFADRAGDDVGALLEQSAELESQLRNQFLEAVESPLSVLLKERLECVRSTGYPRLQPDRAVSGDSFGTVLEGAGVASGKVTSIPPRGRQPRSGEVVVIPPAPLPTYRPQAEEVSFALTYVECGEKQSFTTRLKDLETPVRARLLDKNKVRLAALEAKLRDAVRNVST